MIIRKDTPLYGGKCQGFAVWTVRGVPFPARKRAFSGQKARQCVPQCILGGVAVLFTVRKHACAPEATP